MSEAHDEGRWQAVLANDIDADGEFFYAVATTGIYCRPSCHSRPPRLENVVFFESAAEAAQAGYRPCKRCTPDRISPVERRADRIANACRLIETSEKAPQLTQLAQPGGDESISFPSVIQRDGRDDAASVRDCVS